MPGFPILTTIQPIVGTDMHKAIPPPIPTPPMVPHVVVWGTGLSQNMGFPGAVVTSKASSPSSLCPTPVRAGFGHAAGRTHDAGPHPGHIWPNILLPLITLGAASKSEFGSGAVKTAVSPMGGGSADMGINVLYAMNANLDCQDFPIPPMPTGMAMTINYNITASFGLADFGRGLAQMGVDIALTMVSGALCAGITGAISGLVSSIGRGGVLKAVGAAVKSSIFGTPATAKALMNDGAGFFASSGRLFVDGWRAVLPAAKNAWKNAPVDQVLGVVGAGLSTFGLGTPTGYSPAYTPLGGKASNAASGWVDGLFRK